MVKVVVLRNLGGVAGAAAVAATAGCAINPAQPQEMGQGAADDAAKTGRLASASTTAPGEGTVFLHSYDFAYSGQDEFIRSGETITASLDYYDLESFLGWSEWESKYKDHPELVTATLQIALWHPDGTITYLKKPVSWKLAGADSFTTVGIAEPFVVPQGIPQITFDFLIDNGSGIAKSLVAEYGIRADFPVFGAYLPAKLALFDNDGAGKPRTRVVEGGGLVPGATSTVSYTDWRADTLIDKSTLDLYIGKRYSGNRFGPVLVDAQGYLSYDVSAVYSTDGGRTWQSLKMDMHGSPAAIPHTWQSRVAYEGLLALAQGAQDIQIAYHVKARLVVTYQPGEIVDPKYPNGAVIDLREAWDNNGGANYVISVE
jgi:hypothetical protein